MENNCIQRKTTILTPQAAGDSKHNANAHEDCTSSSRCHTNHTQLKKQYGQLRREFFPSQMDPHHCSTLGCFSCRVKIITTTLEKIYLKEKNKTKSINFYLNVIYYLLRVVVYCVCIRPHACLWVRMPLESRRWSRIPWSWSCSCLGATVVGAANWTQFLWKSSKSPSVFSKPPHLLYHLLSPHRLLLKIKHVK